MMKKQSFHSVIMMSLSTTFFVFKIDEEDDDDYAGVEAPSSG
jgi:hypothetical protein